MKGPYLYLRLVLLLWSTTAHVSVAQECDANGRCDNHERCPVWKEEGECYRSRSYMMKECFVSCSSALNDFKKRSDACLDIHEGCADWAQRGECEGTNANDMIRYCPLSCGECDEDEEEDGDGCTDNHDLCGFWAEKGECEANPTYMKQNCPKSCDACPEIPDQTVPSINKVDVKNLIEQSKEFGEEQVANGADRDRVLERLAETIEYMNSDEVKELPERIFTECKNRNELCTFWQVIGECEANPSYMQTQCAASCHTCHLIDHEQRCPKLPDAVPGLTPGDLNKMFQRIVQKAPGNHTDELTEEDLKALEESQTPLYSVRVHSQPTPEAMGIDAGLEKISPPWVVVFEDFLTPAECEEIIQLGYKHEYKRSEDVGALKFDGTFDSVKSSGRTSENAWCSDTSGCRDEEVVQRVQGRMASVMDIPVENSEDLQLLKYEKGQFYKTHHDYIPHQRDRQCGPRILTFFLYLSDVEAGGGTNFPQLDITVMPKQGRALLWPSVLNSNPKFEDKRMRHQALPVEAGTKFAANGWIHLYDYQGPQKRGCT